MSGLQFLPGFDDAVGHHVGAGKRAAKINDQAFDVGRRQRQPKGNFGFGVGLAADFEKIRRSAAAMGDHVHGRHGQAGTVGEHADIAVKLDEFQPGRGAAALQRGELFRRAFAGEVALPKDRGIVERELAIQRDDAAVFQQRQRIDLDQLGVACAVNRVERFQDGSDFRLGIAKPETGEHGARGAIVEILVDLEAVAANGVGPRRRDLLDLHAAFSGEQDQRTARGEIGEHRGVEFAGDLGAFLDQHFFDTITVDVHAEDRLRRGAGFGGAVGFANAAGLAALAGRHLRLDHARPDLAERGFSLVRRMAQLAARHRDRRWDQHLRLGDVLLEIHHHPRVQRPYLFQCGPNSSSSLGLSSGITVTRCVMLRKCL